jgi:hypothetical protein
MAGFKHHHPRGASGRGVLTGTVDSCAEHEAATQINLLHVGL